MKIKQIKENIIPTLRDSKDEKVKKAGQEFLDYVNGLNDQNGVSDIDNAITVRQEELRKIQLNQEIRQLERQKDNIDVNVKKIPVDFKVPDKLKTIFKKGK